jgi:6-bladed beta-propeller
MRKLTLAVAVVFACGLLSGPALLQQQRGGEDETGPYEVVPNWPQPLARKGYALGSQGGVFAESPNRIILVNRGEIKLPEKLPNDFTGAYGAVGSALTAKVEEMRNCIIIVDGAGKMIESWTQWDKLFQGGRGPHKVKISPYDPQRHVWVIDDLRQQVFKFTHDGKQLVMTLGEAGVAGADAKHFGRPTDIAWLPDGTFFISDGYTNTRVMKFDKDGKFLLQWGTPGTGNSQFNTVHAVDIDRNRKVYVSDRGNGRIQIFDENGKYLDQFGGLRQPQHVMITADGNLAIIGGNNNKFVKYDLTGKMLTSWGTQGTFPGGIWNPHQFSVDTDGNLYIAEATGGRTQKFRPRAGADRSRLVGPPPPLMPLASN